MSEKDFDWSDDLDFESLAEEKEMTGDFGEPDDSFAGFEDLADYADSPESDPGSSLQDEGDFSTDEVQLTAEPEPSPKDATEQPAAGSGGSPRAEKVVSPGGLGFLVAACTLVGALGMAGALLVGLGASPLALWDPSGFTAVDQILNFQDHPLNLFYLVAVGVLLLTLMGSALASRLGGRANSRIHQSEALLGKLTSLRLDNEIPWTSEDFKGDPDTSAFVSDVLGAWRLQQARQVRSAGLEGELRRLEKALREDCRDDLADRYDHPLVGTLADAMVGWHDELHAARNEVRATRDKDQADSASIMNLIEDARTWNHKNQDRVEVQATTLKRWSGKFGELAQRFESASGNHEVVAALQGLQKDVARSLESRSEEGLTSLDELVDRGSKLAFQIAMEVARLGPRGERLLPLSQSLEELTTHFRQGVAQAKGMGDDSVANPQAVLTRLEQISVQLVKDGPQGAGALVRTLQDLGPSADKLAANLEEIAGGFGQQDTRLNTLGGSFAELTGQQFDPDSVNDGDPVHPPEGSLTVTPNDPFGTEMRKAATPEEAELDPFGDAQMTLPGEQSPLAASGFDQTDETGLADEAEAPADHGFTHEVTPTADDDFMVESFSTSAEATVDPDFETSGDFLGTEEPTASAETVEPEFTAGADPFASATEPEPQLEPGLPAEEEKVYDLREFGAVRVDQPESAGDSGADEERIYDLAEFGAVALN